uniref:Eukaryotic translation initiation factor 2 subunit 2 n=1 Tax=Anolis carolinensis TaxID=28377 RepID=G1KIG2_ANOCA
MSGDEMIFDPTMSKKKKKKKKPFMLDEEGGDAQTEETQLSDTKEVEPEPAEDKDTEADEEDSRKKDATNDLDDLTFFNQKKKKKKTKKIFDIDEAEEGVKDMKIEGDVQEMLEPEDDLDIMLGKKKKKKTVKFPDEDEVLDKDEAFEDEDSKKDDGISFSSQLGPAWAGSERDYTYDELLNRVFNIMREKNPDMVAGEKRKFVMKPPQVVRVGTKKTSFVNFTDICKLLHRQPKHLLAFLLAELGTSGSIDGNNQLVIKGRFQQKQIENVLRRYIKSFCSEQESSRSSRTAKEMSPHLPLKLVMRLESIGLSHTPKELSHRLPLKWIIRMKATLKWAVQQKQHCRKKKKNFPFCKMFQFDNLSNKSSSLFYWYGWAKSTRISEKQQQGDP